jgi:cytochrome c-type biogenesis protein CcmH
MPCGEGYLNAMLFWVIAALLTLGASLAVLLPLSRRGLSHALEGSHDLEVYRDQLAELDRDAERGLIQPAEAEQARAEIARRILKADKAAAVATGTAVNRSGRAIGMAAVLAVPLMSWGIYAATGSPDLPSQPLAARLEKNPADSSVDELVARAEAHLVANPDDGRGWDVLAPIYARLGRYDEAVTAYRNAIRLSGPDGARQSGLGEAIAVAAGGAITVEAQEAFKRALELEPGQPKASFFLASALAQEGKVAEAATAWQAMLASLPAGSPWRQAVEQAIAEAGNRLAAAPGPTQQEIDAAASMSDEDRTAMIETMVAGLDEKLRQNPRDPEGWTRLVRSYQVLGRTDKAQEALKRGLAALGEGSDDGKRLASLANSLGLTVAE